MKKFIAFVICASLWLNVSAQNTKSYAVEFLLHGKKLADVQYYYVHSDTAYKVTYFHDNLTIANRLLNNRSFTMVAIFGGKMINFRIETDSFYYLKIEGYRKGFKTIYTVNHGSDYEEIVKPFTKKTLVFSN